MLPCLHTSPINPVVFRGPSASLIEEGNLILGRVSRLDAFSVYPYRTPLPSLFPWQDNWYTGGSSIQVLSYCGQLPSSFLRAHQIETVLSHDVLNPAHVPL